MRLYGDFAIFRVKPLFIGIHSFTPKFKVWRKISATCYLREINIDDD